MTISINMWMARLGVFAMTLLAIGCQSIPSNWSGEVRDHIDDTLEAARTVKSAVPSEVTQALLPPIEITLPEGVTTPIEPRFNLAVSNASARQVFMGLVEATPYSMIVHPEVRGQLSLNLKDVTVPEAMSAIRQVYGYEYRREDNRFYVLGAAMQTRLFSVNYLNLIRKGRSDTRVSGGGISQRTTGGTSGGSTGGQSGFSSIELQTSSEFDFWKSLVSSLTEIVGRAGGRKVIVNSQTGVVVVRAMPEELRIVEEYLDNTHAAVNRQVILEAKIIEVELNDRYQTGINWATIQGNTTISSVGGGANNLSTTGATSAAGSIGSLRPGTGSFNPTLPGTLSSAFGGVFSLASLSDDFSAFVELLRAQGEVQVLSSPRVSTINNQKAVIKIGGDEFFVTNVSSTDSTSSGGIVSTSTPEVELTSFFSGIVLDVTPQIDDKGNIILHMHPSVSTVVQSDKNFNVSGQAFSLPLALSTIQESDNVVRASSGQIIVIGGLMKEGMTDEDSGIPILADIPILGNLFKHKKVTRIKKELVILLKPTVINTGEDWGRVVRDSQERIRTLRIGGPD